MALPSESQRSLAWSKRREHHPPKIQRKRTSGAEELPKQRPCGSEGAWTRMKARVAGMQKMGARSHRAMWTAVQASLFILRKTQSFRTILSSGVTRFNLLFLKVHFGSEWKTYLKGTPVIRRSE